MDWLKGSLWLIVVVVLLSIIGLRYYYSHGKTDRKKAFFLILVGALVTILLSGILVSLFLLKAQSSGP